MPRGEVHPPALIDDGGLQRLRQLDEPGDAGGGAGGAIGHDHRGLRRDQQLRRLGDCTRVALRRRGAREPRHSKARADLGGDRIFLKTAVEDEHHRHHRRRHRDLVGAHRRLREMRQRNRQIVPLDEVADHRRRVLHAVRPFNAGPPQRRVQVVAGHDVDRDAVAVGVVDRHRRVLDADRAVAQHRHRLAFGLEVAVRHRHRGLFVAAGDELRRRVAAVVDDRLVDAAEARSRVGRDIFEVERLDDVDHEVAAWSVGGQHVDVGRRIGLARRCRRRGLRRRRGRGAGHGCPGLREVECRSTSDRGALEKVSTIDGTLLWHRRSPCSWSPGGYLQWPSGVLRSRHLRWQPAHDALSVSAISIILS